MKKQRRHLFPRRFLVLEQISMPAAWSPHHHVRGVVLGLVQETVSESVQTYLYVLGGTAYLPPRKQRS